MLKAKAIELLGGTTASAAKEIGISYQAVDKWPDVLPPRIADRVLAAQARKHLPASLTGEVPAADNGLRRRATDLAAEGSGWDGVERRGTPRAQPGMG